MYNPYRQNGPAKSDTPVLDNFGIDITKAAEEGTLDPIVGRDREIERLAQILSRRKMYIVIMTLSIISIYLAEKNYNYANLLDIKSSYRGLRGLPNKVHFVNKMRILLINNKYHGYCSISG